MKELNLHYAVIRRQNETAGAEVVCGLPVEASAKMAAIFDGNALIIVPLDRSVRHHAVFSLRSGYEEAKKVATCDCHKQVPDAPTCP